ncbi:MAG: ABC transporter permease [Eubacteriales bacterium]
MKLLSTYLKEMKIAFRGFYFYIEVVMAAIILTILLVAVKESPESKEKEFIFFDMDQKIIEAYFEDDIKEGTVKFVDPAEFELKPQKFEVTNKETGKTEEYEFHAETVEVQAVEIYDKSTGELDKMMYLTNTEEDMMRLSYAEKGIGATISFDESWTPNYVYYTQGYETERMQGLLYILHNESLDNLVAAMDNQQVRKLGEVEVLNNRQNLIPSMIVLMGSMMGYFIVIAYVYLDKDEGVIKAFAVTPSAVWKYLMSKALVIMTTVTLSSSVITIPVMGLQPNYLLFYLLLWVSTFAFAALGLLIASFFDSMTKAFGVLFGGMMIMMLPALSYFIPSFDPVWMRYVPTYPLMQGFKEIIMVSGDSNYVLLQCGIFLVGGIVLFLMANLRFKKTLTV